MDKDEAGGVPPQQVVDDRERGGGARRWRGEGDAREALGEGGDEVGGEERRLEAGVNEAEEAPAVAHLHHAGREERVELLVEGRVLEVVLLDEQEERRERENRHHPAARVRAGERVCEQQWAREVRQHVDVQPRERALHYVVGQRRAQQREPRLRERPPERGEVAPVLRRQRPLAFLAPRPARLPRCLRRSRPLGAAFPLRPARGLRARPLTRAGAPGAPACGRAGGASAGIFHAQVRWNPFLIDAAPLGDVDLERG